MLGPQFRQKAVLEAAEVGPAATREVALYQLVVVAGEAGHHGLRLGRFLAH